MRIEAGRNDDEVGRKGVERGQDHRAHRLAELLATIAGAAGGVYAGREVEKRINARTVWVVKVRFGDGSAGSYEFAQDPGFRTGDAVKKAGNSVSRS